MHNASICQILHLIHFIKGFSIISFCEELRPKQNYTQFIWGFMEARVQNGASGGYMHAVIKPVVQQRAEIWTRPPHLLPREAYYSYS